MFGTRIFLLIRFFFGILDSVKKTWFKKSVVYLSFIHRIDLYRQMIRLKGESLARKAQWKTCFSLCFRRGFASETSRFFSEILGFKKKTYLMNERFARGKIPTQSNEQSPTPKFFKPIFFSEFITVSPIKSFLINFGFL